MGLDKRKPLLVDKPQYRHSNQRHYKSFQRSCSQKAFRDIANDMALVEQSENGLTHSSTT